MAPKLVEAESPLRSDLVGRCLVVLLLRCDASGFLKDKFKNSCGMQVKEHLAKQVTEHLAKQVEKHLAEQVKEHQKQNAKPESEAPVSPSSATGGSPSAGPSPKETITEFSLSNTMAHLFHQNQNPTKKYKKYAWQRWCFTSFFSPKKTPTKIHPTPAAPEVKHENRTRGRTSVRQDSTSGAAWLPSPDIPQHGLKLW